LEGFTYDHLGEDVEKRSGKDRRTWLKRNLYEGKRFNPQPYAQLVKILSASGISDQAHEVQFAYRESERKDVWKNQEYGRWVKLLVFRDLFGYGIGYFTLLVIPWYLFQY
jgi:hypothetical protein